MEKSPFKEGDVIFYQEGKNLFIWFTKYPLTEKNKVYIPEAYLIVKNAKENNSIILIEKEKSFSILVVKEGNLVSQITYRKKPTDIDNRIVLLAKEHSLKDYRVIKNPSYPLKWDLRDIIKFSNFEFSRENVLQWLLSNMAIPLSVFFIGLSAYKILDYRYLKMKKSSLENYLIQLKQENRDIKKKIRIAQEKKEFWEKFIKKELKYPPAYPVLAIISNIIYKNDGFIESINYSKEMTTAIVGLPKKRKNIIQEFLNTGFFRDVKIVSVTRDRLSKDYEILNMEFYMKEIQDIKRKKENEQ